MLRRFLARVVLASLVASVGAEVCAQAPQEKEEKYEFFSGTITAIQKERVSVLRAIPGKPEETKNFLIKESTIVEGKLEVEARVTVGYVTEENDDIAVRIIVREGR